MFNELTLQGCAKLSCEYCLATFRINHNLCEQRYEPVFGAEQPFVSDGIKLGFISNIAFPHFRFLLIFQVDVISF